MNAIKMILGETKEDFSEYDNLSLDKLNEKKNELEKLLEENDDIDT